jgi:hypothetical protein
MLKRKWLYIFFGFNLLSLLFPINFVFYISGERTQSIVPIVLAVIVEATMGNRVNFWYLLYLILGNIVLVVIRSKQKKHNDM